MLHHFSFPFKNLTDLERRFQQVPFQYSQVVAFTCMTANIMSLSALSSTTKPNHFLSTDNSLFTSGNDSGSVESKENGTAAPKTNAASKQVPTRASLGGGVGGLFDDEDEDDDFFSGKSLKKSDSGKCVRISTLVLQSRFRWDPHPQTMCWLFFLFFQLDRRNPRKLLTFLTKTMRMGIFSVRSSVRQLQPRARRKYWKSRLNNLRKR